MSATQKNHAASSSPEVLAEPTAGEYEAAADWAEQVTITPGSPTAVHGEDAAALGRALLRSAGRGRPSLDPHSERGHVSPQRRLRLPESLNAQLDAYVAERIERGERTNASEVMRRALAEFLQARRAS